MMSSPHPDNPYQPPAAPVYRVAAAECIDCQACGYSGKLLRAHHGYKWWMLPAALAAAATGWGLIAMAIAFIWLGNQTYPVCPQCGERNHHQPARKPPTPAADEIYENARRADEAAFGRNKLVLLAIVMCMVVATAVFVGLVTPR